MGSCRILLWPSGNSSAPMQPGSPQEKPGPMKGTRWAKDGRDGCRGRRARLLLRRRRVGRNAWRHATQILGPWRWRALEPPLSQWPCRTLCCLLTAAFVAASKKADGPSTGSTETVSACSPSATQLGTVVQCRRQQQRTVAEDICVDQIRPLRAAGMSSDQCTHQRSLGAVHPLVRVLWLGGPASCIDVAIWDSHYRQAFARSNIQDADVPT